MGFEFLIVFSNFYESSTLSTFCPGHAMFLRMTGEAGPREELRFLVKAICGEL